MGGTFYNVHKIKHIDTGMPHPATSKRFRCSLKVFCYEIAREFESVV